MSARKFNLTIQNLIRYYELGKILKNKIKVFTEYTRKIKKFIQIYGHILPIVLSVTTMQAHAQPLSHPAHQLAARSHSAAAHWLDKQAAAHWLDV